jgi:hypothetical protein
LIMARWLLETGFELASLSLFAGMIALWAV